MGKVHIVFKFDLEMSVRASTLVLIPWSKSSSDVEEFLVFPVLKKKSLFALTNHKQLM